MRISRISRYADWERICCNSWLNSRIEAESYVQTWRFYPFLVHAVNCSNNIYLRKGKCILAVSKTARKRDARERDGFKLHGVERTDLRCVP